MQCLVRTMDGRAQTFIIVYASRLCVVSSRVVESLVEERGRPRIWTHTPVSGEYTGACAN